LRIHLFLRTLRPSCLSATRQNDCPSPLSAPIPFCRSSEIIHLEMKGDRPASLVFFRLRFLPSLDPILESVPRSARGAPLPPPGCFLSSRAPPIVAWAGHQVTLFSLPPPSLITNDLLFSLSSFAISPQDFPSPKLCLWKWRPWAFHQDPIFKGAVRLSAPSLPTIRRLHFDRIGLGCTPPEQLFPR